MGERIHKSLGELVNRELRTRGNAFGWHLFRVIMLLQTINDRGLPPESDRFAADLKGFVQVAKFMLMARSTYSDQMLKVIIGLNQEMEQNAVANITVATNLLAERAQEKKNEHS